jgi:acyl-CoA dehydrogenase
VTAPAFFEAPGLWVAASLLVALAAAYRRAPLLLWSGALTIVFLVSSGIGVWTLPVLVVGWLVWILVLALLYFPSFRRPLTTALYERGLRSPWPRRLLGNEEEHTRHPMPWLKRFTEGNAGADVAERQPAAASAGSDTDTEARTVLERILARLDPWKVETQGLGVSEETVEALRAAGWYGVRAATEQAAASRSARDAPALALVASRSPSLAATLALSGNYEIAALLPEGVPRPSWFPDDLALGLDDGTVRTLFLDVRSLARGGSARALVDRRRHDDRDDVLGVAIDLEIYDLPFPTGVTHLAFLVRPADPRHYRGEADETGPVVVLVPRSHPALAWGSAQRAFGLGLPLVDLRVHGLFLPWDGLLLHEDKVPGMERRLLVQRRRHAVLASGALVAGGLASIAARAGGQALLDRSEDREEKQRSFAFDLLATIAREALVGDAVFDALVAFDRNLGDEPELAALLGGRGSLHVARALACARRLVGRRAISAERRNPLGPYLMLPALLEALFDSPPGAHAAEAWRLARRLHPNFDTYVRQLLTPEAGARARIVHDRLLIDNLGRGVSYAARSFLLGLRRALRVREPGRLDRVRLEAGREIERLSAAYALLLEIHLFVHQGRIFVEEPERALVLRRVLGTAFELMALLRACVSETGEDGALAELYATSLMDLVAELEHHIHDLVLALPYGPERGFLRFLVSPFGRAQRPLDPAQERRIAAVLVAPSTARDRLVARRYVPRQEDDPGAILEWGLELYGRVHDARRRLADAVERGLCPQDVDGPDLEEAHRRGLIDEEELRLLRAYAGLRRRLVAGGG